MLKQIKKHFYLKSVKLIKLYLVILLLSNCSYYAKFSEKNNNAYIGIEDVGISKIEIQKWHVGPLRRQRLSKGIRLQITFPMLAKKNLQKLIFDYGVDSWLIRLKRRSLTGTTNLGYYYVPLTLPGRKKNKWRIRQLKKGYINVFYAAAAISTRLESFACPSFDHRKIITDVKLMHAPAIEKTLTVGAVEEKYFSSRVTSFSYKPSPINAGMDLIGEYVVEIAMYHAKKKRKYSNFVQLPMIAEVVKERTKRLRGCLGYKPPVRGREKEGFKKFKFGR